MEKVMKKQTWLSVLFGINEETNNEYDEEKLDPEQIEAQNRANKLGEVIERAIVTEGKKISNNGGFSSGLKIDSNTLDNTLEKMRNVATGEKTIKEQVKESQIGGNEKI